MWRIRRESRRDSSHTTPAPVADYIRFVSAANFGMVKYRYRGKRNVPCAVPGQLFLTAPGWATMKTRANLSRYFPHSFGQARLSMAELKAFRKLRLATPTAQRLSQQVETPGNQTTNITWAKKNVWEGERSRLSSCHCITSVE